MPNPILAVGGLSAVAGIAQSKAQTKSAKKASAAQTAASQAGIDEQRRQFDAMQKLLAPYVAAGGKGLAAQMGLMGLNGAGEQAAALDRIRTGPAYQAMLSTAENAMLQNASATGGLRGGNTQAALAQFRPQLLSQEIDRQMAQYGGLASMGQNAAAGVGNNAMAMGGNIAGLLQQQGAAQAGGALARGAATANAWGNIAGAAGWMGGQFAPPDNASLFGKWGF